MRSLERKLNRKIKALNELLWGGRVKITAWEKWLRNFDGVLPESQEKIHALYMLSCFMYFGSDEMRSLLKTLYNEFFRCRIVSRIRERNANTDNAAIIEREYEQELNKTRFIGVGTASESGTHLLYLFRQENSLLTCLCKSMNDIIDETILEKFVDGKVSRGKQKVLRWPDVKRYVFIDDFCGSGRQGSGYLQTISKDIRSLDKDKDIELWYCVPFGTPAGIEVVRSKASFDQVDALNELDDSYKCFSDTSRYFGEHSELDINFAKQMCEKYGRHLYSLANPLGYDNGQMLIGFNHNVPDNTLPIIWTDSTDSDSLSSIEWHPIFPRYAKK